VFAEVMRKALSHYNVAYTGGKQQSEQTVTFFVFDESID
jgi:hypothetical protein